MSLWTDAHSYRREGTSGRERLGSRGNGNLGWGLFLLSDDMRKLRIALMKQGDGEIMIWSKYYMMLVTIVVNFYPTSKLLSGITYFARAWFLLVYALKARYTYIYSCSCHDTLNAIHPSVLQYMLCVSHGLDTVQSTQVTQVVHSPISSTRVRVPQPSLFMPIFLRLNPGFGS